MYVILLGPQDSKHKVTLIPVGKSLSGVLYKVKNKMCVLHGPHICPAVRDVVSASKLWIFMKFWFRSSLQKVVS